MTHGTWQIDQLWYNTSILRFRIFYCKNQKWGGLFCLPYSEIWVHKRVRDGNLYSFMYSNFREVGPISVGHTVHSIPRKININWHNAESTKIGRNFRKLELSKSKKRKMYSLKNNLNLYIFLNGNQSLKDSDDSFHKKLSLKVQF